MQRFIHTLSSAIWTTSVYRWQSHLLDRKPTVWEINSQRIRKPASSQQLLTGNVAQLAPSFSVRNFKV